MLTSKYAELENVFKYKPVLVYHLQTCIKFSSKEWDINGC